MNAQRVLRYREWRRCATAPLLHSDLPHLVSNCTAVVLEGLPLEQRLGPARFLGLVASAAALTQGLHLLVSKVAADWLPRTALAGQYYSAYGVGFSGVAMALRVRVWGPHVPLGKLGSGHPCRRACAGAHVCPPAAPNPTPPIHPRSGRGWVHA